MMLRYVSVMRPGNTKQIVLFSEQITENPERNTYWHYRIRIANFPRDKKRKRFKIDTNFTRHTLKQTPTLDQGKINNDLWDNLQLHEAPHPFVREPVSNWEFRSFSMP